MARVASTPLAAPGKYPTAAVVLTMVAADTSNKNSAVMSGRDMLIVQNTDVSAHTITINSVSDDKNRTGDVTAQSIAAGKIAIFGPLPKSGWCQTDGTLHFEANDASVKFAVIKL